VTTTESPEAPKKQSVLRPLLFTFVFAPFVLIAVVLLLSSAFKSAVSMTAGQLAEKIDDIPVPAYATQEPLQIHEAQCAGDGSPASLSTVDKTVRADDQQALYNDLIRAAEADGWVVGATAPQPMEKRLEGIGFERRDSDYLAHLKISKTSHRQQIIMTISGLELC
jgi:hypothetical protein